MKTLKVDVIHFIHHLYFLFYVPETLNQHANFDVQIHAWHSYVCISAHTQTQFAVKSWLQKNFFISLHEANSCIPPDSQFISLSENTKKVRAPNTLTSRKTPKIEKSPLSKRFRVRIFFRMNIFEWIIYHHMRLSILHRTIYNTTYKFLKSKSFLVANFQLSPECCIKTACCQKLAKEKLFCALKLADKLYAVG